MGDLSAYMGDPLIAAIDRVLLNKYDAEKPRDYIGASSIGDDCSRKLWYKLQGKKERFDPDAIKKIEDGHTTEAKIVSWLRAVPGIELHTHDEHGEQYGFSDLDGKFKGHYDGVVLGLPQSPKTWHIFEVKCVGDKYFRELKKIVDLIGEKEALQKWRPVYYAQAVLYMWYEKLDRHVTIVATPGGRELMSIRTESNAAYAKALRDKAARIIAAQEPPERVGGKDFWACKQCSFYGECHS